MTCSSATGCSSSIWPGGSAVCGRLPHLRRPPLDLLPLEAPGRPARARGAAPARAAAAADAQPALGAGRGADRRLRARRIPASGRAGSPPSWRAQRWGGLVVSHNGVWRCLRRHGLNTRQKRLSLVAGYRAPYEPPREPAPEPHVEAERPGELVGIDCFYVGRLHGTQRRRLAADRDRRRLLASPGPSSSSARSGNPSPAQTSQARPPRRHAS